jgi:hypothetical protein
VEGRLGKFSIVGNVPGKVAGFRSLHNRLSGFFHSGELPLQLFQGKTRGSSLRSWLSVFAKFWLICRATPDLKKTLPPTIENMIRKLDLTESSVKRAKMFEKHDLLKFYKLENTLANLVDKAFAVVAIAFAARGCLLCE